MRLRLAKPFFGCYLVRNPILMKIHYRQHRFTNFMLFAIVAMLINITGGHLAGYATVFSTTIYAVGCLLLLGFIALHKKGYEFAAKLGSSIFFNAFFFTFTYYYGLQSLVFIYYIPFVVSYTFLYKEHTTKKEAKIFIYSAFISVVLIFLVCTMNGIAVLTKEQQIVMYKKNFILGFALSAYYFDAIFNYLMVQMKLAQEASHSKARFLSIMSHELRTPLNGIISSINLMAAASDEREKKKYSHVLKSSSEHLLHLVNNVLDYSKASSGKLELHAVSCSVDKLLRNLKSVFQSRFDEKHLALDVRIDKELKTLVLLDDIRLVQVLTNLLSNALKFTEKGMVLVEANCIASTDAEMEIMVSVEDTGCGLTKEQQERIFDSFNTVRHRSRKLESSGLGLSISKMIVENMGGRLMVQSEPEMGSRFYFKIKLPLAPASEKEQAVFDAEHFSLEGVKILIAEDNPINMMVAREFLKRWKVNIVEAQNGLVAQQMLLQQPDIELLLLDLQMPEMDGYELMNWIRATDIDIPVIAFTAQVMAKEEKKELFQLGFIDMIPKPFAPKDLQQKITSALILKKELAA